MQKDIDLYVCLASVNYSPAGGNWVFGMAGCDLAPVFLVRFTLKTHTLNDDKDPDTGIFVDVHDKNGTQIGYVENAQRSNDKSMHYNNNEVHQFSFPPLRRGIKRDDCFPSAWRMGIQASGPGDTTIKVAGTPVAVFHGGNDRWEFDAWLSLFFSDGTSTSGSKLTQALESNNGQLKWDDYSNTN